MKTTAPNQAPEDLKEKITEMNVTEMGVISVGTQDVYGEEDSGVDPIYQAKAKILNDAFQEMGMGRYQWYLFLVTGFGWFSDNLWPASICSSNPQ
ncbi:hypothetical protein PHLCEN_2v4432 [Hermanssonia centrifuga]|uniref:Uncharacterized protein n=1 Tax=Hermanssonia centrifuga TaxID=98765 RepID=A0A2R6PNK0_9APHY|nr:hypothetical protein PHLCEN_2v4432 [Hermanssonia centrifuga]